MRMAESNPTQEPADRSKQGAQEASSTPEVLGAGSQQTVLMYGPAAHLMHAANYGMNDLLSLKSADFTGCVSAWKLAGFLPHNGLWW